MHGDPNGPSSIDYSSMNYLLSLDDSNNPSYDDNIDDEITCKDIECCGDTNIFPNVFSPPSPPKQVSSLVLHIYHLM